MVLNAMKVNVVLGGAAFTVGQLIDAVGFLMTAAGAAVDSATIANIVYHQLQSAGLVPGANGTYTPSSFSGSNFICDANNASTMFDIIKHENTGQIDTPRIFVDGGSVATVIVENAEGQYIIISPGVNGTSLQLVVDGDGNTIKLIEGATVTVNGSQTNTIHNSVTGQDYVVSGGKITAPDGNSKTDAGAVVKFSLDADGTQTATLYGITGQITEYAKSVRAVSRRRISFTVQMARRRRNTISSWTTATRNTNSVSMAHRRRPCSASMAR
jgi:hypothetical protein